MKEHVAHTPADLEAQDRLRMEDIHELADQVLALVEEREIAEPEILPYVLRTAARAIEIRVRGTPMAARPRALVDTIGIQERPVRAPVTYRCALAEVE
jgi:hypothetical protein